MKHKLFAMDTFFYNSTGYYSFETRCDMLRELGYDGMYFLFWGDWPVTWEDFPKLATVPQKFGLEVAGVYLTLDIGRDESDAGNARALRALETMEGCRAVEIALTRADQPEPRSDEAGDPIALRWLERLAKIAERRDFQIGLYPHFSFWLEKFGDALRLSRTLNHPRVKPIFCGFHWYAADNSSLFPLLESAGPNLHSVNLCGSQKSGTGGLPATIEPLDEGAVDNFAIVWKLHQLGFTGWYGLQGYHVGSDVYDKLRRSIRIFREFEARTEQHPNWQICQNP